MSVRPVDTGTDAESGPRTLRRGLQVLKALQEHGKDGMSMTDLWRRTGLQRPTLYRLVAALTEGGVVAALPGTKRYVAAAGAAPAPSSERDPRIDLAFPYLQQLASATGDAVFLVVRDGDESVTLWREIGPYPVQILATFVGKRQPIGVGSGGMALLAGLDDCTVDDIIARNSKDLELYGGMTPREMRRLVDNTRLRGYSVVGNYAVRGALGVGCALRDPQQNPTLAISVTAITERMPASRQRDIASLIQDALKGLAARL